MSAPSDGARADARKARLGKLVSSDWDSLADWLGAMDEARNIFHITDEATTVINIDVEELAQRLAGVIADAKAEGARAVLEAVKGDSKYGTPQQIIANMLHAARAATARFEVGR